MFELIRRNKTAQAPLDKVEIAVEWGRLLEVEIEVRTVIQ